MTNNTKKIKAVGYCRFSSDMQREESITAQKRFIQYFADQNGYEVLDWYCDEARSGKTMNRPNFLRLIDDVKNNPCFEVVICHKLDRFSRNTVDTLQYKDLLKDNGIDLITVAENIDDTPAGKMLMTMMASVNQYYIENLGKEVMKGMKETAYQLKSNGGCAPLGYDIVNQKYEINTKEAEIVKLIFEMYADGYGYGSIIDKLNALGYKTKANQSFGKNSLYSIIHNEKYMGTFVFNKRSTFKSNGKRNNHKYKPDDEIIRIPNGIPAIVSEELWKKANAMTKINAKGKSNAKYPYILSGLVYCSECGAKMHGNHRTGNGKADYTSYRCNKKINNHSCSCKEIRTEVVDNFVLDALFQYFFNSDSIPLILDELNKYLQDMSSCNQQYIDCKNNLSVLTQSRNNLIEAIALTGFNQAISDKLNDIEKQIGLCNEILCTHEKQAEEIVITKEDIEPYILVLKQAILSGDSIQRIKYLLKSYIEKVEIGNTEIKVTFNVAFSFCLQDSKVNIPYKKLSKTSRKDAFKLYSQSYTNTDILPLQKLSITLANSMVTPFQQTAHNAFIQQKKVV